MRYSCWFADDSQNISHLFASFASFFSSFEMRSIRCKSLFHVAPSLIFNRSAYANHAPPA